jgi:hypothetical protein
LRQQRIEAGEIALRAGSDLFHGHYCEV